MWAFFQRPVVIWAHRETDRQTETETETERLRDRNKETVRDSEAAGVSSDPQEKLNTPGPFFENK